MGRGDRSAMQTMARPLSAEQEKQLGMVQGSARYLLDLINDVLDLSKMNARRSFRRCSAS